MLSLEDLGIICGMCLFFKLSKFYFLIFTFSCLSINVDSMEHDSNDGLNIVVLGDSNTSLGGDSCNCQKGWTYWFSKSLNPKSCTSYARSGATWTNTANTIYNTEEYTEVLSDNNVIYNQVNRLKESVKNNKQFVPDIIIISAGTNDAWFHKSRPHVLDKSADELFAINTNRSLYKKPSEVLSLAESVKMCCEILKSIFPHTQIILITPQQTTKVNTSFINKIGDIIEQTAQYMSIGVIRLDYNGCVSRQVEKYSYTYTTDGTHTNIAGAKKNGYYIAKQVINISHYNIR